MMWSPCHGWCQSQFQTQVQARPCDLVAFYISRSAVGELVAAVLPPVMLLLVKAGACCSSSST
ncbi:hypothetical protein QQP08_018184 [Theobroma cacao]|nr:hypothetical protein QQP08_018184 [Theobroma cacao]